jgi:hypothetical protein
MENKFEATDDVWFIVKSGSNIHHGKIKAGESLASLNKIDTYSSEDSWKEELTKLGVEAKDFQQGPKKLDLKSNH